MTNFERFSYFLLRVGMGVLFLWAGWVKIIDPKWTSAGYIAGSKIFIGFYSWLLRPEILPTVDFFNKWGLTLIGIALLLGVFVRLSSVFGFILMWLYYIPIYSSLNVSVDQHVIFALVFFMFTTFGAGKILTLNNWIQMRLHPMWHKWVD